MRDKFASALLLASALHLVPTSSVALPPDPVNLHFVPGSREAMMWDLVPGVLDYGLYLGRIHAGAHFVPNHRCAATEIREGYAEAHEIPAPGDATYYLVESLDRDPDTGALVCQWPGERQVRCGQRTFVDPDAAGAGTGLSWADAFTTVSAAVDAFFPEPPWPPCSQELVVRGNVSDGTIWLRFPTHVIGGFAGHEDYPWERDPQLFPTRISATFVSSDSGIGPSPVVIEDLILASDDYTISLSTVHGYPYLEAENVTFERYGSTAIEIWSWERRITAVIRDSRFLGGPGNAIRAFLDAGGVDLTVSRCEFSGAGGARISVYSSVADPYLSYEASFIGVTQSRFEGGTSGIELFARNQESRGSRTAISASIDTSVFHDLAGDAVVLHAAMSRGDAPGIPGRGVRAAVDAVFVGNTVSDIGGRALNCIAQDEGWVEPTLDDECTCRVRAWDNLITYTGGYAFSESVSTHDVVNADVQLVGNDCYSNLACLLKDGTTPLSDPEDVNALPGNADNWSERPVYRLRAARDYHLAETSPAIDRGHLTAPVVRAFDIDLERIPSDGDGDGIALPDVGADEF